ncbi:thioredoxin family protein [Parvibaculum sp.]|uniref:DUF899 domain-containing protein n=1 Tax=Parvibaculum sp. TaxID=2024848 RepID=UPI002C9EE22E|nr:thioredoxin family protein [Parvibaculum sp.]HUD53360.1 thioredoxin family protein [Parvibaculum sp.]
MEQHKIVSREEWLAARKALLAREKELTHLADEVAAARLAMPWVKVEKSYVFDTLRGRKTLAELFDGRSQLIVYHFMFAPGWTEGCPGCSFLADHIDGANLHLAHHDVTLMVVSRAPLAEILPFRKRMGWRFDWASSHDTDFNSDYGVSFTKEDLAKGPTFYNFERREKQEEGEAPGTSVFYKNEAGEVFHTYSSYARGGDVMIGAYNWLDIAPKGRNEAEIMDWMRHHDRYEERAADHCCGGAKEARG